MFRTYGIVGKYFVNGNNVCGNIVTSFQERLNEDHHWVSDISEVCVIFHFLRKMSLGLIMPGMCSTSTSFNWWHSKTIFSRRFRCLMTFEVTESAYWTEALLSLYILVQEYASGIPISLAQCFSDWSLVSHLLMAMIFDSQEINAIRFWWIYLHAIGPPERQMRKLEREQNLNSSRIVLSSTVIPNLSP